MTARDPSFSDGLVGSLRTGLVGIDASCQVVALSREGAAILACPGDPAERLGEPVEQVLRDQPAVARLLADALDGRDRAGRAELELASVSGREPVTIGYTLLPVRNAEGAVQGSAILFRDLTLFERRDEQDRLRDRLAALGHMAAGLAHELRNPLASLEVLLGLLKRRVDDPEDVGLVEEALGEIRMLAATVTASLEFVRPVALDRVPTPARSLLADALARARARVDFGGEVVVDVDPALRALSVDPEKMRRALVDVVANALEAMGEAPRSGGHQLVLRASAASGGGTLLEICDSGPGVAQELRERIFHPFFTTRAEGTGVGLAEVQKVVAAHGGSVDVAESEAGGARFRLHLPEGTA